MRNDVSGTLKPSYKAAILMMALPPDEAASLFGALAQNQVQAITQAVAGLPVVSEKLRDQVVDEFYAQAADSGREYVLAGGGQSCELRTTVSVQVLVELGWLPHRGDRRTPKNGNRASGYITAVKK